LNTIALSVILTVTVACTVMGIAGIISWWVQSRGHWINNPYGRWVMTFLISGSLLAATSVSVQLFGRWPGSQIVIVIAWMGLCVALAWPLFLWWGSKKGANG
jgi:uncharacterized membrane protein YccC